jgi:hypothetical protein
VPALYYVIPVMMLIDYYVIPVMMLIDYYVIPVMMLAAAVRAVRDHVLMPRHPPTLTQLRILLAASVHY